MNSRDDAYQITWLVRRLFRAMAQKATEAMEDLGVSAADRATMEFLTRDGALSVPEIAARYQVSRQHVQKTVNALQQRGLVSAAKNPSHKRSPLMSLTAKGRAMFTQIRNADKKLIAKTFGGISASKKRVTRETLEALLKKLD
jgi:DNA-binding MarR family transcriptional regulator